MSSNVSALSSRFEGRLFVDQGRLYYVIEVDNKAAEARVSCRIDGETQIVTMPVADVAAELSAHPNLMLDGLNKPETEQRVFQADQAWYYSSREGDQGPFDNQADAKAALKNYIIAAQER